MICLNCETKGRHFHNRICPACRDNGVKKADVLPKQYKRQFDTLLQVRLFGQCLWNMYIRDIRPTKQFVVMKKVFEGTETPFEIKRVPAVRYGFTYMVKPDQEQDHQLAIQDYENELPRVEREAEKQRKQVLKTQGDKLTLTTKGKK